MIPVSFHCRFVALIILVLVLVLIPVHSREGFGIEKGKRIEEDVLDYYEEEGDSRNDTDHEAANANPPDSSEEDDGSDSTDDSNIKIEGEGFQINYILIGGAVLLQFVGAVIFVYVRIFKWERYVSIALRDRLSFSLFLVGGSGLMTPSIVEKGM